MNYSKLCRWAACFVLSLMFAATAGAQNLYYNKVDTLKFGQRFNFRTNTIDWLAMTPNVGVEFTLGNKNWSRWTVGVQGRVNWKEQNKETRYLVYDLYDGRIQLRKYWHAKKPTNVFYWGVYGGGNKFDIKVGKTGRQGNALYGGLMFGYVKQLYGYMNGSSLDLDLGINAGVVFADYKEYERVRSGHREAYVDTKAKEGMKLTWNPWIYAASTDVLRASLIYHFGPKVYNKYKKRIDIDNDYRVKLAALKFRQDSLAAANKVARRLREDSLFKIDYEKRFEQQRIELEKKYQQDSLKQIRIATDKENKLRNDSLKLAKKVEDKQRGDSLRQAKRAEKLAKRLKALAPATTTTATDSTATPVDSTSVPTATETIPVDTTATIPVDTTTTIPVDTTSVPVDTTGVPVDSTGVPVDSVPETGSELARMLARKYDWRLHIRDVDEQYIAYCGVDLPFMEAVLDEKNKMI